MQFRIPRKLLLVVLLVVPLWPMAATQTVARRVLVLNFENSNKNADYDYLSESLSDNLRTELIKTKKFTVLDERSLRQLKGDVATENLSVEQASQLALETNCEAVVIGRFMASARSIRISAEAIDALSARAVTAAKADGEITSRIFETIDQLVMVLVSGMQEQLPPIDAEMLRRDQTLEEKLSQGTPSAAAAPGPKWRIGLALGASLPVNYVGEYLGGAPSAELYAMHRWKFFSPYAAASVMLFGGRKNTIRSGAIFSGSLGLAYQLSFKGVWGERFLFTPLVALGIAHSDLRSDYAAANLTVPAAQGGFMLIMPLKPRVDIVLGGKLHYLFDQPRALLFANSFLALEYKL